MMTSAIHLRDWNITQYLNINAYLNSYFQKGRVAKRFYMLCIPFQKFINTF